ncbi:S-methyl-5-thioribose-1-phosphate isomerase [Phosphitispora fastidiosa]|uniref:S-methyl-5-thioribose-1-phosphate isomerase n=1 Tax=Phosphitispora fastidiosa TaxID=2837202 RepID=UPI001E61FA3E|nr:S-methyl-5-thioribose-1-phosphate isomerase [Phosphitispora fastidiosa]MBU7005467.1 methylthioribose-1-phosphate isomerase [Phosphitispora fastidiosa]
MKTMDWCDKGLILLDQTRLPLEVSYITCSTAEEVAVAIKTMQVRGAPAIGAAAAYGLALAALHSDKSERKAFIDEIEAAAWMLGATRPTAVNLFWALNRMTKVVLSAGDAGVPELKKLLLDEAHLILREDIEMNQRMGKLGSQLVPHGARILTHCNAGALATGGYGTALGVIRAAHEAGKEVQVFADETRPLLQGARLTAWELQQDSIPVTLITDNMAGYLMQKGLIDLAVVGADRITANGDVANKIGTYTVAVLCGEHGIPFYAAAPFSTIDMNLEKGDDIIIEEREAFEVTTVFGQQIAPQGIKVINPAFDVTPNRLVTAIITDRGIVRPPYIESLRKLFT